MSGLFLQEVGSGAAKNVRADFNVMSTSTQAQKRQKKEI